MAVLIPGWFIIIPNHSDINMLTILLSLIFGISLRWYFDRKDSFYFEQITLNNFLFITAKMLFLISLIAISMIKIPSIYILSFISIISGFIIPWHPDKLRQ